MKLDPVIQHYYEVILFMEQLLIARTPRMLPKPSGLKQSERRQLANLLAAGHKLHDMSKRPI
jgi:hypothetical protein